MNEAPKIDIIHDNYICIKPSKLIILRKYVIRILDKKFDRRPKPEKIQLPHENNEANLLCRVSDYCQQELNLASFRLLVSLVLHHAVLKTFLRSYSIIAQDWKNFALRNCVMVYFGEHLLTEEIDRLASFSQVFGFSFKELLFLIKYTKIDMLLDCVERSIKSDTRLSSLNILFTHRFL